MKVLSIGTDRKVFEESSDIRKRIVEYGKIFNRLDIVVFSSRDHGLQSKIQIGENVFAYPTNSKSKLSYIKDAFKIASKLIQLDSVLSTQDPFETGLAGLLLKIKHKIPLQIQVHTDFANRYFITHSLLNFIRFPLGLFVLSFADSVRVVSEKVAKSVYSLSNNISVLPIYTEVKSEKTNGVSKKEEKKEINFLTVCRLEKEKDLRTLIKAFKKVLDKGIRATFVVVGEGKERRSLELLAESLKLKEKVKFVGWQNDLERFYKDADVYLSSSLYEGYGMSVVEAAESQLALVLSNTGVAGSLFKHGESAFVLKQKDTNGFAESMIKLATDFELRKKMGEAAKHAADKEKISFEEYLEKYKNSLQEAILHNNSNRGIFKKNILLRYLVAGIIGASTQIFSLYIFTDILDVWYIYSSVLSFLIAMVISFTLQKFWTFGDRQMEKAHHQFIKYAGVAATGLLINTCCMYVLVDVFGMWYIFAQIITGAIIAVFNFLMYKFFIFHKD